MVGHRTLAFSTLRPVAAWLHVQRACTYFTSCRVILALPPKTALGPASGPREGSVEMGNRRVFQVRSGLCVGIHPVFNDWHLFARVPHDLITS